MQVEVADIAPLRKQLTVTFSAEEVAERFNKQLARVSGQVKMPGFRPGRIPRPVLLQRFGADVRNAVHETLVDEGLKAAVKEKNLSPIGRFEVDAPKDNAKAPGESGSIVITGRTEVRPAITLPPASEFSVSKEDTSAGDAEIQTELDTICKRNGGFDVLAAGVTLQKDDVVTLTGKVLVGTTVAKEVHDLRHVIGAYPLFGKSPDDMVNVVAGHATGAYLHFETTLPAAFKPEEFANQVAHVSVTVQSATRNQPAQLTDELAVKVGAKSLDDLKTRIKEGVSSRKADTLRQKQLKELGDALLEKLSSVEVPPQLLAEYTKTLVAEAKAKALKDGTQAEQFDARLTEEESKAKTEAEKAIRRMMIMLTLSDVLNVTATREDFDQQLRMAAYYSGRKVDDIAKDLYNSGRIDQVAQDIREAKALDQFLDQVLGGAPAAASASA